MTAINQDGQVYWTFEDLDLEGEMQKLWNEYKRFDNAYLALKSLYSRSMYSDLKIGSSERNFAYERYCAFDDSASELYKKAQFYWEIYFNISKLFRGGVKNV